MFIHFICFRGGIVIGARDRNNDKYHRILEASVKVFADHGFHQSTVSQIAREAGVADGTIYLYFKNKEDILVQIFNYKTTQIFERFREVVDSAENPVEKLRNLIRRHLQEFQQDRNLAVVYLAETRQINRVMEDQIKVMSKMYFDLVAEILEQGQQDGHFRKALYLGLVKRHILGSVDEVISTWLHADGEYDLVSMADPLVDLFINGIGT
ncbi:MAG TPA: TetR/AcrR family transcriptional regulator [Deltaproteobacteria bacterium]|nr:TetR/AcrR family transcriptional regulator [Deltaproteobacteria bacterium]